MLTIATCTESKANIKNFNKDEIPMLFSHFPHNLPASCQYVMMELQ